MTWNVENLFCPPDLADEDAYRRKLGGLRQVIVTAAPDLLAVRRSATLTRSPTC